MLISSQTAQANDGARLNPLGNYAPTACDLTRLFRRSPRASENRQFKAAKLSHLPMGIW